MRTTAPYGTWKSPITAEMLSAGARRFDCPRVNPRSGRAFFSETTPDGRNTIVEITKDGLNPILPNPFSAENTVYGYGTALYDVLHDDRIVFFNRDESICVLDSDSGDVSTVIQRPGVHYGSFSASAKSSWVVAVEEYRVSEKPQEAENYIVAINVDTSEVKRAVAGADFYFQPRFNADGTRISWTQYNRPELPYTDAKIYCADWCPDGTVINVLHVAGENGESIAEPKWGPDGTLFFAKELGPYRQLFKLLPGSSIPVPINLTGLEKAEFSFAGHVEPTNTFTVLSRHQILATPAINGVNHIVCIDTSTGEWRAVAKPDLICHVSHDAVCRYNSTSALVIGSGTMEFNAVHRIDVASPEKSVIIRKALDEDLPTDLFALPEPMAIRSRGEPLRDIHAFLWMPNNPKFAARKDELPPAIIETHGGPTSQAGSGLTMPVQYFTTRGYAYVEVNYTGSTGYGRHYRQALFGNWGVLDRDDVIEVADHLVDTGRVRAGALGLTGASAGGYNTLQVLSKPSRKFSSALCFCGVSDLEALERDTHKIESDSVPAFVLSHPRSADEEQRHAVYRERSALYNAENIVTPLLLIHGQDDTSVPIEQARSIHHAVGKQGVEVRLIEVLGEGHMLDKPDTVLMMVTEAEKWWKRTLLGNH